MKKERLIFTFSLMAVALLLFYWFQWRPSEIRKDCVVYAKTNTKDIRPRTDTPAVANNYYRDCLARNGLKPESLFVNQ